MPTGHLESTLSRLGALAVARSLYAADRGGVVLGLSVLGPVEVSLGGAPVDLGTRKQRALVAALALPAAGRLGRTRSSTCSGGRRPPAR